MTLDEKRSKSIDTYHQKVVDKATDKNMPWEDMDVVREAVYQYTGLCEETMERDVEDDDIETLDDLIRILEWEVNNYVVE